jgi:hypothetical protein
MSNFNKILEAMKAMKQSGGGDRQDDENFWRAELDKAGNGYAIIRFLPGKTEDDLPFVRVYDHGFQGASGRWFIEKCPTTIGGECPVCQANGVLWNSGIESNKDIVRKRKRREAFIANVLVVSDPKNTDNEGKVFKFKFGKKIMQKLLDTMEPPAEFVDEKPVDIFDMTEGANFKLKIRKVDGFANFDKSEFDVVSAIPAKKQKEILGQLHDLQGHIDPTTFKTFDELNVKFKRAVAVVDESPAKATDDGESRPVRTSGKKVDKAPAADEDNMDYFRSLAEETEE